MAYSFGRSQCGGTVVYTDALNRQSVNENGTLTGYTPDGVNQYTSVNGRGLGCDGNFNLTGYNGSSFGYDAQNHLMSASGAGASMQCVTAWAGA